MDNISVINSEIFKELLHVLESWWKITVNVANQVNSGLFNNFVSSRAWLEVVLGYMKTLGHGINIYSTWWTVPVILLFTVSLPLYLAHYWAQKRLRAITSNIPGPSTFPILGNISTFTGCNLVQFFEKLVDVINKYGPVVRFWEGNKLYIVISDAESIETLLTNKALNKKNMNVSKIVNGNGTVVPDDDKWKIHRRIISSTFNSNVLDHFMGNFVENSSILTQKLKSHADESTFDIYPFVCACALDVICETTMGTNVSSKMEGNDVFMKILLHSVEELGETFKKPWTIKDWIHYGKKHDKDKEICVKYLHEFVEKVMEERIESRRNGFRQNRDGQQVEYVQWVRGREMCLLDLLIQDAQLSVDDIRDELCTLIVAGTKVTATICCYVLSLLGVYQEAQDKVFEEQKKIFGEDVLRATTSKDLSSMKYLEQVCDILTRHSVIFVCYLKAVRKENGHSGSVSNVSHLKALNEFRLNVEGVCTKVTGRN
jgi:cytochrome P450